MIGACTLAEGRPREHTLAPRGECARGHTAPTKAPTLALAPVQEDGAEVAPTDIRYTTTKSSISARVYDELTGKVFHTFLWIIINSFLLPRERM